MTLNNFHFSFLSWNLCVKFSHEDAKDGVAHNDAKLQTLLVLLKQKFMKSRLFCHKLHELPRINS